MLNANSTYQSPQNMTLDEWYNSNTKTLESKRQKQLEDAYVNQQLINKYLGNKLANDGLSNTGVAPLYYANNNANYRNEVANINSSYMDNQQNLSNQYYGYKKDEQDKADALAREETAKQEAELKEKQDTLFNIYKQKVDNSLNEDGYLDDSTIESLYTQFDKEGLGETNSGYLDQYINMYKGSEETIKNANYDKNYKELAYKFESEFDNDITQYDSYLNELNSALYSDKINTEQYYSLKSYLDDTVEADKNKQEQTRETYADAYFENYQAMADTEISKYGVLTEEQYNALLKKYDSSKIGDERYQILKDYLSQYLADEKELEELNAIQLESDLKRLNDSVDINSVVDPEYATVKSFGSFNNFSGDQNKYINKILEKAEYFDDGDIIDANYGIGTELYMYYKGKFYKVSSGKAKITEDNIDSFGPIRIG